jgi:glycosyltransferase involved in cell wall biosynthesis
LQVKTLKGAIDIATDATERLHVLGGSRINLKSGLRITLSPLIRFHGMIDGEGKNIILEGSKGLLCPAQDDEPFSMAAIESLYFGCPIFGSTLGALPEILGSQHTKADSVRGVMDAFYSEFGVLHKKTSEISAALKSAGDYDRTKCHQYACDVFSADRMADQYIALYEQVLQNSKPDPIEATQAKNQMNEPILAQNTTKSIY